MGKNPFGFLVPVLIIITGIIVGNHGELRYKLVGIEKYETVQQYETEEANPQNFWNVTDDERKEACEDAIEIARRLAKVATKFHPKTNFVPEVHQYEFVNENTIEYSRDDQRDYEDAFEDSPTEEYTPSSYGMFCGNLPPVYLRISQTETPAATDDGPKRLLKIIVVKPFDFDDFIVEHDKEPRAVFLENYREEEFEGNPLLKMNLDVRRNLCSTATEHGEFTFFDSYVSEGRVYELQHEDEKEITVAISCPAIPHFLIHQENESTPRKMTFIRSPAKDYVFGGIEVIVMSRYSKGQSEEELQKSLLSKDYQTRFSFCAAAKKHIPNREIGSGPWTRHLIVIKATDIRPPKLYTFTNQDHTKVKYVAVQCAEDPTMYVRLDDSTDPKQMKVMVFPSTAEKLLMQMPQGLRTND